MSEVDLSPPVVCLGASAGGLEALEEFLDKISSHTGAAYVVVVHLSPDFRSLMSDLLARHTQMTVKVPSDGERLCSDTVYIIPPATNMFVRERCLWLQAQDRGGAGHKLQLPIDLFLRSLALDVGAKGVAVILSGTGSDGSRGIRDLKANGGVVLAQTPQSTKFDGMVMNANLTGQVDGCGTPAKLAELVEQVVSGVKSSIAESEASADVFVEEVLRCLAEHGFKLFYLRQKMVLRRTRRRMLVVGVQVERAYLDLLRASFAEAQALCSDLLIRVTDFFRDTEIFKTLESKIIPEILMHSTAEEPIRIWVSACSSGQEVYSILILFMEIMEKSGINRSIKVFATDVDEEALKHGSRGVYSLSEVSGIKSEYLSKYFEQQGNHFHVYAQLRKSVIFAKHDLLADPPFTRIDLVTCRNVLIYFRQLHKRRALANLYTAMHKDTFLLLGSAEDVGDLERSFEALDTKNKIFKRTQVEPENRVLHDVSNKFIPIVSSTAKEHVELGHRAKEPLGPAFKALCESEQHSAAIIDNQSSLIEVVADPLRLFGFPSGRPTTDLTRILPRDMTTTFLAAKRRIQDGQTYASLVVPYEHDAFGKVSIYHFSAKSNNEPLFLTVFERSQGSSTGLDRVMVDVDSSQRLEALEAELRQTKESLQATIEELQSASEEQQSTNEELMASNEELQSTNEELHSVNEELMTVNSEYHSRNQDLLAATGDLDNLLGNMEIATLYLDEDLNVLRFTPSFVRVIPLQSTDIGRPLNTFEHALNVDLLQLTSAVLKEREVVQREVRDRVGAWMLLRASPYKATSGQFAGVLVTLVEVTRIKNAEESSRLIAEQLTSANALLADQAAELEDLLSIVAHDLRRPMIVADGMLKLAIKEFSSGSSDRALSRLNQVHAAHASLRGVLTDLTTLAEDVRADVKTELVQLQPWLKELLDPFIAKAEMEGVQLNWACDGVSTSFCRAIAARVVTNLLENAFLHGSSAESPHINVLCQMESHHIKFTVADNGQGIEPHNHQKVFEIFRRLDPKDGKGTGVGLAAARRLTLRAGGTIKLDSETGKGAKFTLELPSVAEKLDKAPQNSSRNVLLVEDNPLEAKLMSKYLDTHLVTIVSTLGEAKFHLGTTVFDLVLLDLSLPDGHGLNLLSQISHTPNQATPFVLISGYTEGLDAESLKSINVVATLSKDEVDKSKLGHIVASLL